MDDCTPVRIKPREGDIRFATERSEERVWFRLDDAFKDANKARILSGPPDHYGYCAYDLESAKKTFAWFAVGKSSAGRYPIWANQLDMWEPKVPPELLDEFWSLCFTLGFSENRCVVTRYERDNPVACAQDVFVENPLSPNSQDSFWSSALDTHIRGGECADRALVDSVKALYSYWKRQYCPRGMMTNCGLADEPYFRHFKYVDFLTENSGLIQIRRFAELNDCSDLLRRFDHIAEGTRIVRDEIYRLLVKDCGYFA